MARIRTIKPEFWTDGNVVRLGPWARLFYVGTWNFALCDQGHLPDDPMGLKLKILPADPVDADQLVDELVAAGRLVRRQTTDGRRFLHIRRFSDHQKLDTRWNTKCPYCAAESAETPPEGERAGGDESSSAPQELPETRASHAEPHSNSLKGSKGRDGTRGDIVPPSAGAAPPPLAAVPDPPPPMTAQELIADWIDHVPKRPPGNTIARVGKEIKAMLQEGIDPADLRKGLAAWAHKGLGPSVLPSVVNEVMNRGPSGHQPYSNPPDQSVYDEAL